MIPQRHAVSSRKVLRSEVRTVRSCITYFSGRQLELKHLEGVRKWIRLPPQLASVAGLKASRFRWRRWLSAHSGTERRRRAHLFWRSGEYPSVTAPPSILFHVKIMLRLPGMPRSERQRRTEPWGFTCHPPSTPVSDCGERPLRPRGCVSGLARSAHQAHCRPMTAASYATFDIWSAARASSRWPTSRTAEAMLRPLLFLVANAVLRGNR